MQDTGDRETTGVPAARLEGIALDEPTMLAVAEALARRLLRHLDQPRLITLHGDLGAGKTTFVRGLLRGLGHGGAVRSPTFTLVEPYRLRPAGGPGEVEVRHFDLYRLADPEEFEYLGERDGYRAGVLWLVEWPERGGGALPTADLAVTLSLPESPASDGAARRVLRGSGALAAVWRRAVDEVGSEPGSAAIEDRSAGPDGPR